MSINCSKNCRVYSLISYGNNSVYCIYSEVNCGNFTLDDGSIGVLVRGATVFNNVVYVASSIYNCLMFDFITATLSVLLNTIVFAWSVITRNSSNVAPPCIVLVGFLVFVCVATFFLITFIITF